MSTFAAKFSKIRLQNNRCLYNPECPHVMKIMWIETWFCPCTNYKLNVFEIYPVFTFFILFFPPAHQVSTSGFRRTWLSGYQSTYVAWSGGLAEEAGRTGRSFISTWTLIYLSGITLTPGPNLVQPFKNEQGLGSKSKIYR
jgi:hypothetical protein